jgi:hypothetical protein
MVTRLAALLSASSYAQSPDLTGRGFFVEVGIDDGKGQAVVLRSFSDSDPLEDYAVEVRLPN